jgi:predicted acetyltransferase
MLRLRPLRPHDEPAFLTGHSEMAAEGFTFGLRLEPGLTWAEYLRVLDDHRLGLNLPAGYVASTFLVADVDGQIVGRTSIRHELNDRLSREGGHIGYGVLPAHRRRGYATEILGQSLLIARSLGIDRVLLTCDDDNLGSITVIEAHGGRLDSVIELEPGAAGHRRYWID